MKKLAILSAVALTLVSANASAVSYTLGYSDSVGTSSAVTVKDNLTTRIINERATISDTVVGGGRDNNTCLGLNCASADNITKTNEIVTKHTELSISETGLSTSVSNTKNCDSFGNVNGLSFSEGTGQSVTSTVGTGTIAATGSIEGKTVTLTHTTNGGAEIGSSRKVDKTYTQLNELTQLTNTNTRTTNTYSSSTGYGN